MLKHYLSDRGHHPYFKTGNGLVAILLLLLAGILWGQGLIQAQEKDPDTWIVGKVIDEQDQPLAKVSIHLQDGQTGEILSSTRSHADGRYWTFPSTDPTTRQRTNPSLPQPPANCKAKIQ